MKNQFSGFGLYTVAEAHIDERQVHGGGGALSPVLFMPVRLDLWHGALEAHEGVQFTSIQGKLRNESVLISNSQSDSINVTLQREFAQLKDHLQHLEFPLDGARVEALERQRKGGDLKLRIEISLLANQLYALNAVSEPRKPSATVWGHVHAHRLQLQSEIVIPRDTWISRVLPHVGYGVVHVLEFPAAPLNACEQLDHSFQALRQAQELHKVGLYDDAVGKCRVALDQFFEYEEKPVASEDADRVVLRRVPKLKKSWETAVCAATYAWLDGVMSAIKGAANRTHHSPNAYYCQADSQMIIAITAAMVAYAARTQTQ